MKAIRRLLGRVPEPQMRVLMVCSGNICRSPTAEAVLRAKLAQAGLAEQIDVDSAGTHGFHAKDAPDARAQAQARKRGYDLSRIRARPVVAQDFTRFQRILAMDEGHLAWLQDEAPGDAHSRIELLLAHATQARGRRSIPDPYYGSERDFELVLDLVEDACAGLVAALGQELAQGGRGGKA
jgi:protein-tyrosine phosphatase